MARIMSCSSGCLPFVYLGLPVGKSMRKASAWHHIAPLSVLNHLESLRCRFLWDNFDSAHYITWVSWSKSLADNQRGGLGIGSLRAKNLSLLCKWWWRMKTDDGSLWCRVIKAIHGVDENLFSTSSTFRAGLVWSDIRRCGMMVDALGISFSSSFSWKVGMGDATQF
ncbi:hypothetical protein Tco_1559726 [Tanacetum coccineum]